MPSFRDIYTEVKTKSLRRNYNDFIFYELFRNEVCFSFNMFSDCVGLHVGCAKTSYNDLKHIHTLTEMCRQFYKIHSNLSNTI